MADITDWQDVTTPSPTDISALAASRPQAYQPSADEAQAMSADLAAIAKKKHGTQAVDVNDWQDVTPPPQMTGIAREMALPASSAAKGIAATLGQPGDITHFLGWLTENNPLNTATRSALEYITGKPQSQWADIQSQKAEQSLGIRGSVLPTSGDILAGTKSLGLTDRPDLQPQDSRERYEAAGFQGAGASIPYLLSGGTGAILPTISAGFGGGIGSQSGQDLFPNHPILGQVGGGIVGGLLGGGIGSLLQNIAKGIYARLSPAGAQNQAISEISRRIQQSAKAGGPTAQDMLDELTANPNKPLTLADVGGEPVQGYAEGVANTPGPGRQAIVQTLEERAKGAGQRLTGDVGSNIASGDSIYTTAKNLMEERAKKAAPLYEEAYAQNQNVQSPAIDRILNTPAGKKALADARVKMQNDMSLMGTPDADLMEQAREAGQVIPGGRGVASGLKLRTLDYVKRSLDDQIGVAQRAGEKDNARILVDLKNKLLKALDEADITAQAGPNSLKPEGGLYAQARAAYSGPTKMNEALDEGALVMKKDPTQIADEIAELAPGEKEMYKLGAANALKNDVFSVNVTNAKAQAVVKSDLVRSRLRPLFDDDASYNRFINSVLTENKMARTNQNILGNSRTALRAAEQAMQGEGDVLPQALTTAAAFGAHEPVLGFAGLTRLAAKGVRALNGPSEAVNAAAAPMLVNVNRLQNEELLRRIIQEGAKRGNLGQMLLGTNAAIAPRVLGSAPSPSLLGGG